MRTFKLASTVAAIVMFVGLVSAQTFAQPAAAGPRAGAMGGAATDGIGKLRPRMTMDFGTGVMPPVKGRLEPSRIQPPVDCAMPMIEGDPKVDAKMVTAPPPANIITFFLRILPAPSCPGH